MPVVNNNKTKTASGDIIHTIDAFGTDGLKRVLAAQIRFIAEADGFLDGVPVRMETHLANGAGALTKVDTTAASSSATLGFGTGSGGTVTQQTDKATAVALNTPTGQIIMNNASLASDTTVVFTLVCSAIAANDIVVLAHTLTGTSAAYNLNAFPKSGEAWISVRNITLQNLAEAIVLKYAVIKSSTS